MQNHITAARDAILSYLSETKNTSIAFLNKIISEGIYMFTEGEVQEME